MRPLLFLLAGPLALGASEPRVFLSRAEPVPLLELFTSEGCSSCPPAEKWLGELRHDPGLWRDFVPIAWHVNYWDRLGWPDRFAFPAYKDRQYAYARVWNSRRVYTPETVHGGVEWSWREGRALGAPPNFALGGALEVRIDAARVFVRYTAPAARRDRELEVHLALLGGGIVSDVKRGENRGRRLEHEFVVLAWQQLALSAGRASLALPAVPDVVTAQRAAVAVWVSLAGEPAPLQATGGWLD